MSRGGRAESNGLAARAIVWAYPAHEEDRAKPLLVNVRAPRFTALWFGNIQSVSMRAAGRAPKRICIVTQTAQNKTPSPIDPNYSCGVAQYVLVVSLLTEMKPNKTMTLRGETAWSGLADLACINADVSSRSR